MAVFVCWCALIRIRILVQTAAVCILWSCSVYMCCYSYFNECLCLCKTPGAFYGAVEACFVNAIPGQTTPLIFKAFKLMATRSVLFGQFH